MSVLALGERENTRHGNFVSGDADKRDITALAATIISSHQQNIILLGKIDFRPARDSSSPLVRPKIWPHAQRQSQFNGLWQTTSSSRLAMEVNN